MMDVPPFPPDGRFDDVEPALGNVRALNGNGKQLRKRTSLDAVALVGRDAILNLARTPVEYVWQDIVVAGTVVLISGPPAEGKTTLLFLVLAARANKGGPVMMLERYVAPADHEKWVIIIEGEHGEASTARKLVKSLDLLAVDYAALDRVMIVARKAVQLDSPEWADVANLVAAGKVSDIALDTIARVAPADANDEREQVAIFDKLAATIERAPAGTEKPIVWVVAHNRKGGKGDDLSSVSGSAQRVGQADTVLMVEGTKVDGRTTSSKVTFAKIRETPDVYPMPVEFSIVPTGAGAAALTMNGAAPKDTRPLTVRIVELLDRDGAQTKGAIKKAMGRSDGDVEAAISELFAHHRLRTNVATVRGVERKTFDLAPISRDDSRDEGV
jgi:AAA domain